MTNSHTETVGVVGAGLVGCLAALAFAKQGYTVRLFEARPDMRSQEQRKLTNLRSINLAVGSRGMLALDSVEAGLSDRVLEGTIPMYGRMLHDMEGNQVSQNYGLYGESNNSIDRAEFNRRMLDEVDNCENVKVVFDYKLETIDFGEKGDKPSLVFTNKEGEKVMEQVDLVVGSDGSYSKTRQQMQRVVRMNYSQKYIDHLYLELSIPPGAGGEYMIDKNHLHIWPRHKYMLIALPNMDGSFTSTLFAPQEIFDQELDTDEHIVQFFERQFKDAVDLIGRESLLQAFHDNPRGSLISIKAKPYHHRDQCILIGDAAHSMVPFYGQGLNCGFEDVRVLMETLQRNEYNLAQALEQYSTERYEDLATIIQLAMDNYVEMRHKVTSTLFQVRRKIDGYLTRALKDKWLPLYTMVSFRPDISYSEAMRREKRQSNIISSVLTNTMRISTAAGIIAAALAVKNRFSR